MAFKNYLCKGTYTNISNLIYEKKLKRCTAMLEIWSDDSKSILLASRGVVVEGLRKVISVFSLKNKQNTIPSPLNDEMYYIIGQNPKDDFLGYSGQLTKYNSISKNWDKWILQVNLVVFVEDEQQYYKYSSDNNWILLQEFTEDYRVWEKWLSPEISMTGNNNPMQKMYELIKTFPQFKDCEDA